MNRKLFWDTLFFKVRCNLKSEAKQNYLNYAWWILEPALLVLTFYIVFGVLRNSGGLEFVSFLCVGQIPFLWFSRTVSNSSMSIVAGRGLMNLVKIPKSFFPLVVIFQDLVKSIFVFFLLLLFLYIIGVPVYSTWLQLPIVMLIQFTFTVSISLLVASLVPFFPDLRFIVSTGIMMLMFGSGVFYNYKDIISPEHYELFLMNPMANIIEMFRNILLDGVGINLEPTLYILLFSISVIVFSLLILKKYDTHYPRLVME